MGARLERGGRGREKGTRPEAEAGLRGSRPAGDAGLWGEVGNGCGSERERCGR